MQRGGELFGSVAVMESKRLGILPKRAVKATTRATSPSLHLGKCVLDTPDEAEPKVIVKHLKSYGIV